MKEKIAIIIGAGPAGIVAANEILQNTELIPIILEAEDCIGGISRTVDYKGNKIDIGGHRFFSKSQRIMDYWEEIFPLQGKAALDYNKLNITVNLSNSPDAPDPDKTERVMLIRNRLSRIYFIRKFFDYPISINVETVKNLGIIRLITIIASYCKTAILPKRKEQNFEDFLINRFGKTLYKTFFKDYTEKVWGVECKKISAQWGAQRIKGLSIAKAILHTVKRKKTSQKTNTETSLIEQFWYPKYGPGQLWEYLADLAVQKGARLYKKHKVVSIKLSGNKITQVSAIDTSTGKIKTFDSDYVFTSMPIKDLIECIGKDNVENSVYEISQGLLYRDFITVGLLLDKLKIKNKTKIPTLNNIVPDNWIYIQEPDVKIGRLQIFNNWSPYMVADLDKVWIGLEYFCQESDKLWSLKDEEMCKLATNELEKIDIINAKDVIDKTVIRIPKAYPAYFGSYDRFNEIQDWFNNIENLFPIGRNGMHKYNNMDHSMLSAIKAVECISNSTNKADIWNVNTESQYHESN